MRRRSRRCRHVRRRIAFVCGCMFVFVVAVSVPDETPSPGSGEMEVTIHLGSPDVDDCGAERIEVPDAVVGMWVRKDPVPLAWSHRSQISGLLVWSHDNAVLTTEGGAVIRYEYSPGSMDCSWG